MQTIIIVLALLCILPFAAQLFLRLYISSSLHEIAQLMEDATDKQYHFSFDAIRVNIFRSSIHIKGFTAEAKEFVPTAVSVSTGDITVTGIGIMSYLTKNRITFEKITIKEADIELRAGPVKSSAAPAKFNLYEIIKSKAASLHLDKLRIEHARISYYQERNDSLPSLVSENSSLTMKNVLVDSSVTYVNKRWFNAEEFLIISEDFRYTTADSLYTFSLGRLTLSYEDSLILLDSFSMSPNFSDRQFGKKAGKQTDRMSIEIPHIKMVSASVKGLIEKKIFAARAMVVSDFRVRAFRDKNIKRVEQKKPTLQALIRGIPVYVKIDSLVCTGRIQYTEIPEGASEAGSLFFSGVHGTLGNITNDSLAINKPLTIVASAKLMGESKITVDASFPYSPEGNFSMKGHMAPMNMQSLNPVLENVAFISIRQGFIKDVIFAFHADIKNSRGTMTFLYNDLRVDVLNKETGKSSAIKELLSSVVANKLVIEHDNPDKGKTRHAALYYERNPNKFIFNYCWKTVLSGVKETIGLNRREKKKKN